jgi:hypothetical protein
MVAKAKSEKRQKTKVLGVRATPEEHAKLKAKAAAFGISMGELCRETLFGTTPKSKIDQEGIEALAVARADLGRLGGLLKGWLAGSFPDAPEPDSVQIRDLLKKSEAAQAVVVSAVKKLVGNA